MRRNGRLRTPVVPILAAALLAQVVIAQAPPLSEPGPTFRIPDSSLPTPLTLVLYGDQRFTDPSNVVAADPKSRSWLAREIAAEKPAAVILNGDVPYTGSVANDYAVFRG